MYIDTDGLCRFRHEVWVFYIASKGVMLIKKRRPLEHCFVLLQIISSQCFNVYTCIFILFVEWTSMNSLNLKSAGP